MAGASNSAIGTEPKRPCSSNQPSTAPGPLTVPESTNYDRTSSHDDVLQFLDQLVAAGAPFRLTELGQSTQGRSLTLAIVADPPIDAPPAPETRDRAVCFIQGNIHAGEVEGKEALLMLLRDLTLRGEAPEILQNCILLMLPNYNPDGNDAFGPARTHRPRQGGPAVVGRRHNAQNLDLNRDYMKARSSEFPIVAREVFNKWDPDLFMDLHATNGSYHGYTLTYAPPLHPGGAKAPLEYARDVLLPSVRGIMREQHGYETFDYGNFDSQADPKRWATYDYRARMGWLYAGMRGRIGILSEAYAYAPFQNRIDATYWFVRETIAHVARNREAILEMHRQVDRDTLVWGSNPERAPEIAIRAKRARRATDERMLIETTDDPPKGQRRRPRLGLIYAKQLEVYDRFETTQAVKLPAGYLLPPTMTEAAEMLDLHGVRATPLEADWEGPAEVFTTTGVKTENRRFSGGLQSDVEVTRTAKTMRAPRGWLWVPTAQRQGRLAFQLLEPDAADSLFTWQRAGIPVEVGQELPHFRVLAPIR